MTLFCQKKMHFVMILHLWSQLIEGLRAWGVNLTFEVFFWHHIIYIFTLYGIPVILKWENHLSSVNLWLIISQFIKVCKHVSSISSQFLLSLIKLFNFNWIKLNLNLDWIFILLKWKNNVSYKFDIKIKEYNYILLFNKIDFQYSLTLSCLLVRVSTS